MKRGEFLSEWRSVAGGGAEAAIGNLQQRVSPVVGNQTFAKWAENLPNDSIAGNPRIAGTTLL
jgi:hypothetical protein